MRAIDFFSSGRRHREARALAYRPRTRPEPAAGAAPALFHDVLLRLKGVSQAELNESRRYYAGLPLDALLDECPPREFRARAREAWQGIVEEMKAAALWERVHRAPPEVVAYRQKRKAALKALLSHRDRDAFMDNIMEYARQFTPPNKAAKAVGRIKRAVQTGWEIPMESALAVERELQQRLFASEDAKEGLAAYVEKRPATFKAK